MLRRCTAVTMVTLLGVGLGVAGCGGDGGDTNGGTGGGQTTTADGGDTGVADGQEVFANNCSTCHGASGKGGNAGPPLHESDVAADKAAAEAKVRAGGGGMPAFEGQLDDSEIEAVAEYVSSEIAGS